MRSASAMGEAATKARIAAKVAMLKNCMIAGGLWSYLETEGVNELV